MHKFKPGDRLRSKLSGHVFVYAIDDLVRPDEFPNDFIPVRDELWSPPAVVWLSADRFEAVDDDYFDPARSDNTL